MHIVPARPSHAHEIADLFCRSFAPQVAQLLIYGCRGAAEHIRRQVSTRLPNIESVYFVAEVSGQVAAAMEFRRRPNVLFLNYIAVTPESRGQRLGSRLFSGALSMLHPCAGHIELDVLDDNVGAMEWYRRLGFTTNGSSEFVELATPAAGHEEPALISGLAQSDLCQERFGFSTFNLICQNVTFTVGRVGDAWFRLTDPAAAGDPAVFTALRLLDPARRIFAVAPVSSIPTERTARVLAITHRMSADLQHVTSALNHDHKGR